MAADLLKDPLSLDEDDLVAYLTDMPARGHSRSDVTRACRSFYGCAEERGLVRSPAKRITPQRIKYGPAPALSEEQVSRLIVAAANRNPRRGWAIVLLYATGARVGSFVNARPDDVRIDGDKSWIDFRETKGGQPYRVPLGPQGREAARVLIETMPEDSETLVGVGRAAVEWWVRAAGEESGIRAWPHLLRHSFMTRLAERGVAPDVMRELANHRDYSQLARYITTSDERKRDAVAMF
jgi:integrase